MNDRILELIKKQFILTMREDSETFSGLNIEISSEQQFVKLKNKDKNTIYIVVSFLPGSIFYNQTVLPVSINVISEKNKLKVCQKLLNDYTQKYNITFNEDRKIRQTYTSPSVTSNFNEVYEGFRSVLYVAGTFQISEESISYDIYDTETKEKIDCLNLSVSFDNILDTQPFSGNPLTQSVSKFCALTLNFTTYLTNISYVLKILNIMTKEISSDSTFFFDLEFSNGSKILNIPFKMVNASFTKQIDNFPIISATFTL